MNLEYIYNFLAQSKWYRLVASNKTVSIGAKAYYLKKAQAKTQVQINFCPNEKVFIFRDFNELIIDKQPIKELSIKQLMDDHSVEQLKKIKVNLFNNTDFSL